MLQFSSKKNTTQWMAKNIRRLYHEKVMDHFNNPRNACGDVIQIQMKFHPLTDIVVEAKFKTFRCASAIASSSLTTEWVKGKTMDKVLAIRNSDIAKHLSLPPVKQHCIMLAEGGIRRAVQNA